MKMARRHYEERAQRIIDFYLRIEKDKKRAVQHFKEEGIPNRTVHRIINKFEEEGEFSFKKIPGRNRKVLPDEAYEKVAALFKKNPKMSCSEVASSLEVSKSTVLRILRQMRKDNVETYREVESVLCPTCHQRCDPKTLDAIKKRKLEVKINRLKNSKKASRSTRSRVLRKD